MINRKMYYSIPIFVMVSLLFLNGAGAFARETTVNIAPQCGISSSPLPNALWTPDRVADGSTGPTNGWLGSVFGPKDMPWVDFKLPKKTTVTGVEIVAASFTEAGPKRFSRPKDITIYFIEGKKTSKLSFTLEDNEKDFQKFEFASTAVNELKITIDSVYSAGARLNDMAGFQEVRILAIGVPAPAKSTNETISTDNPLKYNGEQNGSGDGGEAASNSGNSAAGGQDDGTLDEDEKEILDLLRELLAKLEKKFRED
jgi:hypothetical protein